MTWKPFADPDTMAHMIYAAAFAQLAIDTLKSVHPHQPTEWDVRSLQQRALAVADLWGKAWKQAHP